jgi:glycosyltransferase involved in cell wall biosynthesis
MKIGFDAKRFFHNDSGLGNYSRDLIRILSTYYAKNEYVLFATKKSQKGKEILNQPNLSFQKLKNTIASRQLQMGFQAQNEGCDFFHGLSGELPLQWNHINIKKIVTIHDVIFMRFPHFYSFFDKTIHFLKFRNAANQADLVLAISEQTKKDIIHYLKIPEQKIQVIYQSCHESFLLPLSFTLSQQVKIKFQLPEKFILNVGTIEERKNVFSVVKAIKGTEIPLVIVGKKTNYYNKIRLFIEENQMQNQVIFLENVSMEELSIVYKLASIFVYPSLFEGFGIPIIEALYSKTPVITSNLGCFPEAGGGDSVYINPFSVEDIKEKIIFLWENEKTQQEIASKSFRFAQKFNDETIATQLIAAYKS